MSDKEFTKLFRRFDPDNGGEVTYEEFLKYFGGAISGQETGGIGQVLQAHADYRKNLPYYETVFLRSDPKDPNHVIYCGPTVGPTGLKEPAVRGNTPRPGTMAGMRPGTGMGSSRSSSRSIIYQGGTLTSTPRSRPMSARAAPSKHSSTKQQAGPGKRELSVSGSSKLFKDAGRNAPLSPSRPLSARSARPAMSYGERVRSEKQKSSSRSRGGSRGGSSTWWEPPKSAR